MAPLLDVEGTTKSRPLLSLNTSVKLGLLQLAYSTQAEVKPPVKDSEQQGQYCVTADF